MGVDLEIQREVVMEMAARLTEARKLYQEGVELLQQEDYPQAGDCISRAAQLGDATAQCHLGFLYENGFFGDPNDQEAVYWYRKAADQCLANGQFRLGACYQLGKGVEQDWEEAARLFELAAKLGHTDAAHCLADLREMGVTPAVSPKEAPPRGAAVKEAVPEPEPKDDEQDGPEFWVHSPEPEARQEVKSEPVARPQPPPMPELPPILDDPAVTDAIAAYQALALQNDTQAQLKLGLAYYLGRSAPADAKLACFWVMRSMLAGDYQAAQYLQYCVHALPPEEQDAVQTKTFMWMPGQPVPQL